MKNKQLINKPDSTRESLVKTRVFNVDITNEKNECVLEFVVDSLQKKEESYFIVTPNPEIITFANSHPTYLSILNTARIALCDGMQLFRAAAFVGKPLRSRITGVDFMDAICKCISKKPITVGFLGGRDGVAKKTAERLSQKYPGLAVVFVGEEPEELENFQLKSLPSVNKTDNEKPSNATNTRNYKTKLNIKSQKHIDILFVAFGFPKQEEWMFKNLSKYRVRVMMGVGGAFDYMAVKVKRAPVWLQNLGLEWLFRLILQPWRIKRQVSLFTFVWLVLKEKFSR